MLFRSNMGKLCERCIKHWIACVVVRGGLGCNNCWAKHYGCSLVPVKEGVGGRGGPSGSQQAKAVVGSQTKGQARKARKPITLGKRPTRCWSIVADVYLRSQQDGNDQTGSGCECSWGALHVM